MILTLQVNHDRERTFDTQTTTAPTTPTARQVTHATTLQMQRRHAQAHNTLNSYNTNFAFCLTSQNHMLSRFFLHCGKRDSDADSRHSMTVDALLSTKFFSRTEPWLHRSSSQNQMTDTHSGTSPVSVINSIINNTTTSRTT